MPILGVGMVTNDDMYRVLSIESIAAAPSYNPLLASVPQDAKASEACHKQVVYM